MLQKELIDTQLQDVIKVQNVTKIFTQWQRDQNFIKNLIKPEKKIIKALDNVSFNVKKGEFLAYAGPNGAGKSTTMKLFCGMLLPSEGEISVLGLSPKTNRTSLMSKVGILFGNRTELWADHPVMQSFEWKKAVWNVPDSVYKNNLEKVVELLDIKDLLKTYARELSLGQRMRADLALMLLHSPEIILLDEPTLGLDVVAKRQMIDFLTKINKEDKVTIMVTSHDMDDLEEMSNRILMVAKGEIAYDGDFSGLREITGNATRISITTKNDKPIDFTLGKLISSENYIHEYEIDLQSHPINEVMLSLSKINDIIDLEIKKAPIEQIIASLYHKWKAE